MREGRAGVRSVGRSREQLPRLSPPRTVDTGAGQSLRGGVLFIVRYLPIFQASRCQCHPLPSCDIQNCPYLLPSVFSG